MISVFGSSFNAEELAAVEDTLNKQWVGFGEKVAEFEKHIAMYLGLENFLMVNSGTNALYLAVKLLDLPAGTEIILPSFTWVGCANAIVLCGHKPVFCDVDPDTQNVSVETVKPCITVNTGAIMVVHYGGKAVDMNPILELGFPVIEDAAHAIDTRYDSKACGGLADIGIYSFDAIKNLAIGEAGGMTFRNGALLERARKMRYCGIGKPGFQNLSLNRKSRWWEYDITEIFIKMLPTDIAASIGLVQLSKLKRLQSRRREIWDRYQDAFRGKARLKTPIGPATNETHSYFTYLIRTKHRDQLARYLLENEIYSTLRYHPLHLNKIYNSEAKLPNTEMLSETALNIPLHPNLTDTQVDFIIDKILEVKKWGG